MSPDDMAELERAAGFDQRYDDPPAPCRACGCCDEDECDYCDRCGGCDCSSNLCECRL